MQEQEQTSTALVEFHKSKLNRKQDKTMENKQLYKFLRTGLKSEYGNFQWEIGKWHKHEAKVNLCHSGFHASARAIDAFGYVKGELLAQVSVRGEHKLCEDKQVWSEMRIDRVWKWTKADSVALAVFAAEQVIGIYEQKFPTDDKPRRAIGAAKAYLDNPTTDAANAARYAAGIANSVRYGIYPEAADAGNAYAADNAADAARYAGFAAGANAWYADYAADAAANEAASAAVAATRSAVAATYASGYAAAAKIDAWIQDRIAQLEEVK